MNTRSGTNAPIAADTTVPSSRKGTPWTATAVKTVHQAATAGVYRSIATIGPRTETTVAIAISAAPPRTA